MADINIERKSRNIWPWIIGIIAILLIAAIVVFAMNQNNGLGTDEPAMQQEEQYQESPTPAPPPSQP